MFVCICVLGGCLVFCGFLLLAFCVVVFFFFGGGGEN